MIEQSVCVLWIVKLWYVMLIGVSWGLEKLCSCHLVGSMLSWLQLTPWCLEATFCTNYACQCSSGMFASHLLLPYILHILLSFLHACMYGSSRTSRPRVDGSKNGQNWIPMYKSISKMCHSSRLFTKDLANSLLQTGINCIRIYDMVTRMHVCQWSMYESATWPGKLVRSA